MFNQIMGIAMSKKNVPPYANLFVGFFEKTILLQIEIPKYFAHDNCKLIKELFQSYTEDGFLPWHSTLDLNVLKNISNNLHLIIKLTVEQQN